MTHKAFVWQVRLSNCSFRYALVIRQLIYLSGLKTGSFPYQVSTQVQIQPKPGWTKDMQASVQL